MPMDNGARIRASSLHDADLFPLCKYDAMRLLEQKLEADSTMCIVSG